jgi:hypothetical protein
MRKFSTNAKAAMIMTIQMHFLHKEIVENISMDTPTQGY